MKKVITIIILINSIFSFGQNENLNQIYVDWENPKNFEKYNVKKVTVYSKEIKKNGKIKRDSLLLAKYEYDKSKGIIKGINHNLVLVSHRGGSSLEFYSFKNQYFLDSLIIKRETKETPKVSKDKIVNNSFIELYKYDNLNRLIYDKNYSEENEYELSKKDTITHYRSVSYPKIKEYEYDFKNRVIKEYFTRDSSEYHINSYKDKKIKSYKSCSSCEEKYLEQEWKYDENKLLEWTSFTYQKIKHSKRNYFYDEYQNLVKQIDSSGWYFINRKPYLDSTTEIIYNQEGKIITSIENNSKPFPILYNKTIQYFDKNNLLIKKENHSENQIDTHEYFYENSILKYETSKYGKDNVIRFEYSYGKKGLLKEVKHYIGDKLVNIERYYYE